MTDRAFIGQKVRQFFEELWSKGDPWDLSASEFERARHARLLSMLEGHRYPRALEIGCGAGVFTRLLARLADDVIALDVAAAAIDQARGVASYEGRVDFRVTNIMEYDPRSEGPWDIVVMSETICYVGWLYPFFDVAWLASELFAATRAGGHLLLANTMGDIGDLLLLPPLIRTYRDLFLNVGYRVETEEIFRGTKHGVDIEVLMSLFVKPLEEAAPISL